MGKSSNRITLSGDSFIESSIQEVPQDRWRPHGVRYRLAWIQRGKCRVLYDNHHGKMDHSHVDGIEKPYSFTSVEQLWLDFMSEINRLGGS